MRRFRGSIAKAEKRGGGESERVGYHSSLCSAERGNANAKLSFTWTLDVDNANATWQAKSAVIAASGSLLSRSRRWEISQSQAPWLGWTSQQQLGSICFSSTSFTKTNPRNCPNTYLLLMVDYGQSSSSASSTSPIRFEPISLDEEARLYSTNAERERYGMLATLFGIIVSLDYLERAYVRDSVPASE